jgi:cardiolipin synthase
VWMKFLADILTSLRLIVAAVLPASGLALGPDSYTMAGALVLVAWTTDLLDGPLARKSGRAGSTWIGRHDLMIDVILALSLLIYMRSVGLIHPLIAFAHVVIWGLVFWRHGSLIKPLGALAQAPVYIWFGISLLARRLLVGRLMVLWLLGNVATTWARLTQRDLPGFFQGVRAARAKLCSGKRPREESTRPK